MSYQVAWLPDAVKDLRRLRSFIHQKNPQAAKRAAQRLLEGVDKISHNPNLGLLNPTFRSCFYNKAYTARCRTYRRYI